METVKEVQDEKMQNQENGQAKNEEIGSPIPVGATENPKTPDYFISGKNIDGMNHMLSLIEQGEKMGVIDYRAALYSLVDKLQASFKPMK